MPRPANPHVWEIVAQDIRHRDEVASVQGYGNLDIGEG